MRYFFEESAVDEQGKLKKLKINCELIIIINYLKESTVIKLM